MLTLFVFQEAYQSCSGPWTLPTRNLGIALRDLYPSGVQARVGVIFYRDRPHSLIYRATQRRQIAVEIRALPQQCRAEIPVGGSFFLLALIGNISRLCVLRVPLD